MSAKMRGTSRKSDFLDKLFGNKRRTILGALGIAIIGYLLFLLFGNIYATEDALYRPVVMGVLAFAAMFLVLGFQLINPFCTPNAMDIAELFFFVCQRYRPRDVDVVIWHQNDIQRGSVCGSNNDCSGFGNVVCYLLDSQYEKVKNPGIR